MGRTRSTMVRAARCPLIGRQTLELQNDGRRYWYAASAAIPYVRTGRRQGQTKMEIAARADWYGGPRQAKSREAQNTRFAGGGGSARIRSLVWRHFQQEIQAQIKTEAGRKMALKCEFCGKAPHFGNVISHANNTRRRRWNPNLKRVRAVVAGMRKHVRICTACIRAGKVKKAA